MPDRLTIRDANLLDGRRIDVRIHNGRIEAIGQDLALEGTRVIEAHGGLLLPGLHDHHVHVAATAAAMESAPCGPPHVMDAQGLVRALTQPGRGWLRGIGYHEGVAGMLERDWLDAVVPDRPVRIQHRSGRMWFLNSLALDHLLASGAPAPEGLDREKGQLFDSDDWMRAALGRAPPDFEPVGTQWARMGVTGVTEMSPDNDDQMAAHFAAEKARGALPQRVVIAGRLDLGATGLDSSLTLGPVKIHLHEAQLPEFDAVVSGIRAAHEAGRAVAVHCVSEVELVFTLAALREAGVRPGDRIEHASVCPKALLADIADQGLAVVVQPNFVSERGDAYRADIPETEWPNLYRLSSFGSAGVTMAGGTDTPFGALDPWRAMSAAVSRRTASGAVLGEQEAMSPEQALDLFLADPVDLSCRRSVTVGAPADLCLLSRPWSVARSELSADLVQAALVGGQIIYDGVDQAPSQGRARADAAA